MYCNIDLYAWLALTAAFSLFISTVLAQTDTYIVHMDSSAMPKVFSTHHNWHLSTLSSVLVASKTATSISAAEAASSKLLYSYTRTINGFSARLSPAEFEILKALPGYISAFKDVQLQADTTHSTSFLGLGPNSGAWKASNYGEGMIIGVVDSGVWPESASYSDKGMPDIPKRWRGECESGTQFNSSLCNRKLIGARYFNKGLLASDPNVTISMNSARDTDGHGTHTSSTAAGNFVQGASYFGYAMGTARGAAPRAHMAVYKVVWVEGKAYGSDTMAAIDQAIIDGVDVLSISLSASEVPFYQDPIALVTFATVEKNIVVTCSAGNTGPFRSTVTNAAPWILTVAAGTMDRNYIAVMKLGNGITLTGEALYPMKFPSSSLPIVFMNSTCSTSREFSDLEGKVVVCEETNDALLIRQFATVNKTNVTGGVFITKFTVLDSFLFLPSPFPATFLNSRDGETLKRYISTNAEPHVSIEFKRNSQRKNTAPNVESYSSRGPSRIIPEVLKPDIMAPGSMILAAWPEISPVMELSNGKNIFNKFNFASGTSMACPHIAGVAALLKKAHPDWSPAAIKSAMMTTAETKNQNNEPIKDLGLINQPVPATAMDMGGGHINPNKALNPGLVYDLNSTDYVRVLCALNYTQNQIRTITKSASNDCSSPSLDLNYPSFVAIFNDEDFQSNSTIVKEFHRTVTNVGDAVSTYTASWTPVNELKIRVFPKKLKFMAKNQKLSYKLVLECPKKTERHLIFGELNWEDTKRKHTARSPIVVANFPVHNIG